MVPGLALIEELPLVSQTVVTGEVLHVGRALAAGAETTAATDNPATNSVADLTRLVMCRPPSGLMPRFENDSGSVRSDLGALITGTPR